MERKIKYSFQPGPAQLFPEVEIWTKFALKEGLLSRYHRDAIWREIFREAQEALVRYLGLPEGWTVAFANSATEIWQILVDATATFRSLHFIQGAFAQRWYAFQRAANPYAEAMVLAFDQPYQAQVWRAAEKAPAPEYIALVHVETSVGAYLPDIGEVRRVFPEALIAADATSSLGGLSLPWHFIDIAFASVQKCLGLPPGLGVLIVSPAAKRRFMHMPRYRYNALSFILQSAEKHEPIHTPNLLGIFLLSRILQMRLPVSETEGDLRARAFRLYSEIEKKGFIPLVLPLYRAPTVLAFKVESSEVMYELRRRAEHAGLYLGWGYGAYKEESFRVANFPALPEESYGMLLEVLDMG